MKKKSMMLGGLLAAVVVTAYSVSGTYAKYISQVDLTDEARVAKWSFNGNQEVNLFADSYVKGDKTYVKALQKCTDPEDSTTCTTDNVVAPGTEGSYTFKFDGKTEVAFTMDISLTDAESRELAVKYAYDADKKVATTSNEADAKTYSPILFRVNGNFAGDDHYYKANADGNGNADTAATTWLTYSELVATLKNLAKTGSGAEMVFYPGENVIPITYTIDWKWDADNSKNAAFSGKTADEINAVDTLLGTDYSDVLAKGIKLSVNVKAEQYTGTDATNAKAPVTPGA